MTRFIIIRHGESLGNKASKFLGHTDIDLSQTGKIQAQLAADFLKNVHIDKIYSSDLLRAYNTVKPTADEMGIKIIKDSNLREIYAGDWENVKFDDLCVKFGEQYRIWRNNIGFAACTNGESVVHLMQRVCDEMEKIALENDGKTVLISTHATPVRCMITKWTNTPMEKMKDIPWVKNASLTYVQYSNDVFTVTSTDFTDHLGNMVTQLPHKV